MERGYLVKDQLSKFKDIPEIEKYIETLTGCYNGTLEKFSVISEPGFPSRLIAIFDITSINRDNSINNILK